MKRGEVWWVNLDPTIGTEISKTRPAVILSNDSSNKFLNRVQIIPLTSHVEKCYPSEAIIKLNGKDSKAMADQITTADKKRLKDKIGTISSKDMMAIEKAVKIQLGLPL
jgi:mRNA interferase MazF